MKTKTLSFQKTYTPFQFVNDKICIEDSFPSTVPDEECFKQLQQRIENLAKIAYPHLFNEQQFAWASFPKPAINETFSVDQLQKVERPEECLSLEKQINSCKEVRVLESYRLIIKSNPDLQKIYDEKLAQLKTLVP